MEFFTHSVPKQPIATMVELIGKAGYRGGRTRTAETTKISMFHPWSL